RATSGYATWACPRTSSTRLPRPRPSGPARRRTRARRPRPRSPSSSAASTDRRPERECRPARPGAPALRPFRTRGSTRKRRRGRVADRGFGGEGGGRGGVRSKGGVQAGHFRKGPGRHQAAFGDDDSPEQHAEDVWQSSHETADRHLVEVLTGEAPGAIHWLEEHGVEFTHENGGYRLARCGGATRKRLLQVGDRTGHAITTALRDAFLASSGEAFPNCPLVALES